MNKTGLRFLLFIGLVIMHICIGACRRPNDMEQVAQPASASNETPVIKLVGIYTLSEIEDNGVVTMVPSAFSTNITFFEDGNFSRTSKKQGMVDHADSGNFRVEPAKDGNHQLILKVLLSDNKSLTNPKEQDHSLESVSDGSQIRLGGTKGKVAVFRRTAGPK